ncbi:unnamed protein product [Musa textilis]
MMKPAVGPAVLSPSAMTALVSPSSGFAGLGICDELNEEEEEEKAIKERRFYLHPSPRGAEPKQLAFSTALGVTLGVFPICGTTVFLCGVAIGLIGNHCHAPSVMFANFVATPIELSLVVPFLRLGEVISGGPHFPLTSDALMKVVTGEASRDVLISVLHALLGWIIAAPFILGALYVIFVPCFKYLVHRFNDAPSSPKKQRAA